MWSCTYIIRFTDRSFLRATFILYHGLNTTLKFYFSHRLLFGWLTLTWARLLLRTGKSDIYIHKSKFNNAGVCSVDCDCQRPNLKITRPKSARLYNFLNDMHVGWSGMGIERGSTSVRLDFFDMWLVFKTTTSITCNFTGFLFAPGKARIITVLICRFV